MKVIWDTLGKRKYKKVSAADNYLSYNSYPFYKSNMSNLLEPKRVKI